MPGLGDLPPEIKHEIARWALADGDPAVSNRLGAVNQDWQQIIDEYRFQNIHLDKDNIEETMRLIRRRPTRFNLVRHLVYTVKLPTYTPPEYKKFELGTDKIRNDHVFSNSIHLLFKQLREWPLTGRKLELQLRVYSETDRLVYQKYPVYDGREFFQGGQPIPPSFGEGACRSTFAFGQDNLEDGHRVRVYGSVLELLKPPLEPVPVVTTLTFYPECKRFISEVTMMDLFRALSGLEEVIVGFSDHHKLKAVTLRINSRQMIAAALGSLPAGVEKLYFSVDYHPPANQSFLGQNLCQGGNASDLLTVAFRNISQRLKAVCVDGMLGTPELLFPKQVSEAESAPFWPHLKRMELRFHILEPTGEWLFEPERSEEPLVRFFEAFHGLPPHLTPEEDKNPMQNRYAPNQLKMNEFYIAVARAVNNMPQLEFMCLQAITYDGHVLCPSHTFRLVIEDRDARAGWTGDPVFSPSRNVREEWARMAHSRDLDLEFAP
ncbi:hypothetical protein F4777DRAFT_595277 [Nemania sp. FL0916]|nr:hypothetical protein F4777DRAFT_595277 [Nemania sp. FL0916]